MQPPLAPTTFRRVRDCPLGVFCPGVIEDKLNASTVEYVRTTQKHRRRDGRKWVNNDGAKADMQLRSGKIGDT